MNEVVAGATVVLEPDFSGFQRKLQAQLGPIVKQVTDGIAGAGAGVDQLSKRLDGLSAGALRSDLKAVSNDVSTLQRNVSRLTFDGAQKSLTGLNRDLGRVADRVGSVEGVAAGIDFGVGEASAAGLVSALGDAGDMAGLVEGAAASIDFSAGEASAVGLYSDLSNVNDMMGSVLGAADRISFDAAGQSAANFQRTLGTVENTMGSVLGAADRISFDAATNSSRGLLSQLESIDNAAGNLQRTIGALSFDSALAGAADLAGMMDTAAAAAAKINLDGVSTVGSGIDGLEQKTSSLWGTATKAAAAVGTLGGGVFLGQSLKRGQDRLTTIEDSVTALTIQLGSAEAAARLMGGVLDSVRGTPFNLDEFAGAARQLNTFGIEVEKIPGYLTAIGEAGAASGQGIMGVNRIVDAVSKANIAGVFSLGDVWRISDSGVKALEILGNAFGMTSLEMKKAISSGMVPAEQGIQALMDGIIHGSEGVAGSVPALAGSMEALRQTFSGAQGGFRAASARFGAAFLEPWRESFVEMYRVGADVLDALDPMVRGVMEGIINTGIVDRVIDFLMKLPERLESIMGRVTKIFGEGSGVRSAFDTLRGVVSDGWGAVMSVFQGEGVPDDAGVLGTFLGSIAETVKNVFDVLRPAFESLGPAVSGLLPLLSPLTVVFKEIFATANEEGGALSGLAETLGGVAEVIANVIGTLVDGAGGFSVIDTFIVLLTSFADTINTVFATVGPAIVEVFEVVGGAIIDNLPLLSGALETIVGVLGGAFADVMTTVGPVIGEIATVFAELIGSLTGGANTSFLDTVVSLVSMLGDAISTLMASAGPAFLTFIQSVGDVFGALLPVLLEVADAVIGVFGSALEQGIAALVPILGTLFEVFAELAPVIADVVVAVLPLVPVLADVLLFIVSLIPPIVTFVAKLLEFKPVIYAIVAAFTAFLAVKGVIAVIAAVGSAIAFVGGVIGTVSGVVAALGTFFSVTFGGIAAVVGAVSAPVLAVVAAIAAVVAGLVLAYNHFEPFRNAVQGVVGWVVDFGKALWETAGNFLPLLIDGLSGAWNVLSNVLGLFGDLFSGDFSGVLDRLGEIWDTIFGYLTGIGPRLLDALGPIGGFLWDSIQGAFMWVLSQLSGLGGMLWDGFVGALSFLWDAIPGLLGGLGGLIWDGLTGLPGLIIGFAADLGGAFLDMFAAGFDWLIQEGPGLLDSALDWLFNLPFVIGEAFSSVGPMLMELGGQLGGWLWDGLQTLGPLAWEALQTVGSFLWEGVTNLGPMLLEGLAGLGGLLLSGLSTGFDAVVTGVPALIGRVRSGLARLPGMVVSGLASLGSTLWEAFTGAFTWLATRLPEITGAVFSFITSLPRALGRLIQERFPDLLDTLGEVFGSIGSFIWDQLVGAFNWVAENLPNAIGAVTNFFVSLPGRIVSAIGNLGSTLWQNVFVPAWNWLTTNVPSIIDEVVTFFGELPGRVVTGLGRIGEFIWQEVFEPAGNWLMTEIPNWIGRIVELFTSMPGRIVGAIGDLGGTILDALLGAMSSAPGAALDFAASIGRAIASWINNNIIDNINSGIRWAVDLIPFTSADGVFGASGPIPRIPEFADGEVVNRPTLGVFGEDGPEVIVPLSKPHRMVSLLTKALAMTGHKLPAFGDGGLFAHAERLRRERMEEWQQSQFMGERGASTVLMNRSTVPLMGDRGAATILANRSYSQPLMGDRGAATLGRPNVLNTPMPTTTSSGLGLQGSAPPPSGQQYELLPGRGGGGGADKEANALKRLAEAFEKHGLTASQVLHTANGLRGINWNAHARLALAIESLGFKKVWTEITGSGLFQDKSDPPKQVKLASMGSAIPLWEELIADGIFGRDKETLAKIRKDLAALSQAYEKVGLKHNEVVQTSAGIRGVSWPTHVLLTRALRSLGYELRDRKIDGSALAFNPETKEQLRLAAQPTPPPKPVVRGGLNTMFFVPEHDPGDPTKKWELPDMDAIARLDGSGFTQIAEGAISEALDEWLEGITRFADGGIVSRPTFGVFGEAGPEVVVPLSNRARMIDLLMQALGVDSGMFGVSRDGPTFTVDSPGGVGPVGVPVTPAAGREVNVNMENHIYGATADEILEGLEVAADEERFLNSVTLGMG